MVDKDSGLSMKIFCVLIVFLLPLYRCLVLNLLKVSCSLVNSLVSYSICYAPLLCC